MKIYNLSGHGELAEYVSDDFGLIVDSSIDIHGQVYIDEDVLTLAISTEKKKL